MFKNLVLTAALVMSVPALASASWYVSAAAQGSGTITAPDIKNAGLNAIPDSVLTETFTVTPVAGNEISAVRVNGVAISAASPGIYTISKKTSSQAVTAYFVATKATVTPSVTGGGAILPVNTLTSGQDYTVKIVPNTNNAITGVVVDGVAKGAITTWTWTKIAGAHTISASFAFQPTVTASVSAAGSLVAGSPVTLSGVASTNDTGFSSYSFLVNGSATGVTQASATSNTATFTPATAGAYVVSFTANTVNGGTKTVTNTVNVLSAAQASLNGCVACHSSRSPEVVAEFTASKHWTNVRNQGDSAVAGDQKATCATNKCHFQAGTTNAVACDTCHSDGLNADGTFKAAYTVGGMDGMYNYKPTAATTCFSCHSGAKHGATTENFKKSSHYNGDHAKLYYQMDTKACVACHGPHQPEATTYEVCLNCHKAGSPYGIYNADMTGKAPHFGGPITQYNTEASFTGGGATCADCHGHNNTINAGWAEGGHGNVKALPWISDASHIWDNQGPATNGINWQNSPQQTNCVRCHTAKGFAKFVDSGFVNIDKNYQADGVTVSKQSAPLTCNGCHLNPDNRSAAGYTNQGLRLANFTTASHGAKGFKAYYGYSSVTYASKKVITTTQLGDNRESNLCMPCHSQRTTGALVKAVFAAGTANVKNIGSNIYPHDAQPGAVFYGTGGYEYTSAATYTDRARHQRIGNYISGGATGYNNTGITQGACVGCHYNPDPQLGIGTHALEAVKFEDFSSALGKTTSARIVSTTCAKCHPTEFTVANVADKKADFDAAVKALENLLIKKGITQVTANGLTADSTKILQSRASKDMSLGTNDVTIAEKNTGAWYNWFLFSTADKGAYVHNPSYARRLIFDSIDWLDDYTMNGSAANTIYAMANVATSPYYNPALVSATTAANAASFTNDPGCLGCHFGTGNVANGTAIPGIEQAPHYNTTGALVPGETFTKAQFVVPGTQCNYCHGIGHGSDSPGEKVLAQYAESAHGDTEGLAWTDYDFKTRDTCNACHTTAGFVKAIGNNWTETKAWGTTGDTTKQVLGCNTCHATTAWKSYSTASGVLASSIRPIAGGYRAGMGGFGTAAKATVQFADQGESNICFPCHATRENGDSLKAGNYNFTNKTFVNPHYLGSAGIWQGKAGFKFYTSNARYAVNKPTHGLVVVAGGELQTPSHDFASRMNNQQKQKGSCVACHMGLTNSHTFETFSTATRFQFNTGAQVDGCLGCHSGTKNGFDRYYPTVATQPSRVTSGGYVLKRALDMLKWQFAQGNGVAGSEIYFDNNVNPYFFKSATGRLSTDAVTNWTTQLVGKDNGNGTGLETMGAAMNLKLLSADKGAAAHNAAFTKGVIADSLVYLQHGNVGDRSSTAAINNISFSAYSAAITPAAGGAPTDGIPSSISNLKGFLTSSGKRK